MIYYTIKIMATHFKVISCLSNKDFDNGCGFFSFVLHFIYNHEILLMSS